MSLVILFHFLCAQHISDINISITRSLRLFFWITTLVVLFLVRCVLEFRCGWVGAVSVLQAEAWQPVASRYTDWAIPAHSWSFYTKVMWSRASAGHEHVWGAGGITPFILHLDIRRMWVVSLISQPHYLRVKRPFYITHCNRRLRWPQTLWRTENTLGPVGNEKRFPGYRACSQVVRGVSTALFWLTSCGIVFRTRE